MKRIYEPRYVWVIRYGGLAPEKFGDVVCVTTTTKYNALACLHKLSDALNEKYPDMMWFEDIQDAKGKAKFNKESYNTPAIFVRVEATCFTEDRPLLPGVDLN